MTLASVGSLLLAAVFAAAGLAKLSDLPGSREAMKSFGVPGRLVPLFGLALPLAELVVAAGLLSGSGDGWAGPAALALFAGFSVAIASNLAQGRRPDCHCFGQLHSSPAGPRTLARNAGLIALAGFVTSQGDPAWTGLAALSGMVLTFTGWILARRADPSSGETTSEGLAIGAPAPPFALPRLDGHIVDLESLLDPDGRTLLVFSDPDCGPCQALAPDLAEWQRRYRGELTIAVIESRRDLSEQPGADRHGRRNVLLQEGGEVAAAYHAHGTPTAVLIDAEGRIASGSRAARSRSSPSWPGASSVSNRRHRRRRPCRSAGRCRGCSAVGRCFGVSYSPAERPPPQRPACSLPCRGRRWVVVGGRTALPIGPGAAIAAARGARSARTGPASRSAPTASSVMHAGPTAGIARTSTSTAPTAVAAARSAPPVRPAPAADA